MNSKLPKKIVLAIGGASGAIYAKRLLDRFGQLKDQIESLGIVMSENARFNWELELGALDISGYGYPVYGSRDFTAAFASGSAQYTCMIICPCSMGTLGRIASGSSDDLTARAADVILKERRQLILVPRETPFNLIHLENMRRLTLAGAIVCPAIPSFYSQPKSIEQVADTVVDRVLQLAGLDHKGFAWGED